jgi:hypothetical protein
MSNGIFMNRLAGCLAGFLPDGPRRGASATRHDPTFGETAVVQIRAGWSEKLPRGQRVLDGLAGVRVDGRLEPSSFWDSEVVSVEMDVSNVALIP